MKKLVITCGGTGGHFYPGLSIARVFQSQGGEVLLLLSGIHASNQSKIAQEAGIRALELPAMPSPGHNPVRLLKFFKGLWLGFLQARRELAAFQPDAVLGMGSFAELPVFLAAHGRKRFLHDGNARIGKANRLLSRCAEFVATAFPAVNAECCACPVICTGMPVRPELEEKCKITKAEAIAGLNELFGSALSPELPTILVVGGSQGAAILNNHVPTALRKLGRSDLQLLMLTGPKQFEETKKSLSDLPCPVLPVASTERMELFFGAADLIFGRSGGSTTAELALFGKAAVLIPYPFAAEGHQTDNARCFTAADAAVLVPNGEFTPERAEALCSDFLNAPEIWRKRGENALELARFQAADALLDAMEMRE